MVSAAIGTNSDLTELLATLSNKVESLAAGRELSFEESKPALNRQFGEWSKDIPWNKNWSRDKKSWYSMHQAKEDPEGFKKRKDETMARFRRVDKKE